MESLKIDLKQDYKQFKRGFNFEFKGKLIIISGVNGSGKSQLIDILSKSQFIKEGTNHYDLGKFYINSEIELNDEIVERVSIARRSFKDNIDIDNISMPNPKNSQWHKDEAWKAFSNYDTWINASAYSKAKYIIEEGLKKNGFKYMPERDFNKPNNTNTHISEEEFKKILSEDFVWEKDDLFSNRIDELFYEFAVKRNNAQVKLAMSSGGFDNQKYIKNAPWTILNELFQLLNFKYRFKKDYEFEIPNFKEKIKIYPILQNGEINLDSPRDVADLSDGEKSIISLTFALLNERRRPIEKLLLLDEFDNTLNPSLIESFFKVLEEFFIKKGVFVLMTTHSPVTISLAPEYATYYEIFKQDKESPKIIPVDKYQYSELKVANKKFYEKIENQTGRIKELEEENKVLSANKIVFVEDKYVAIYKLAWLKLHNFNPTIHNLEEEFSKHAPFEVYSKGNKDNLKGFLANPFMDEWDGKHIVGLFDFDDAYDCFKKLMKPTEEQIRWEKVDGDEKTGLYSCRYKYKNVSALMLPVPDYRKDIASREQSTNRLEVELLFRDEDIFEMYGKDEFSKERVIGNVEIPKIKNKEIFWKKAVNLSSERFDGFKPLFNRINLLLGIEEKCADNEKR